MQIFPHDSFQRGTQMANHLPAQSRAGQKKLLYENIPSRTERHLGLLFAAGTFLVIASSEEWERWWTGGASYVKLSVIPSSEEWERWWLIPLAFTLGFLINLFDRCRGKVRVPNRLFDCGNALLVEHIAARVSESLPFSHIAAVDYEFSLPRNERDMVAATTILRLRKPGKRLAATLEFPEDSPHHHPFWQWRLSKHSYPPPALYTELQRRLDEERKKARRPSP
jgi:hypothetical protein